MKSKLNGKSTKEATWSDDLKQGQFGIIVNVSDIYHGSILFCSSKGNLFLHSGEMWCGTHAIKILQPGSVLEITI